MKKLFAQMGLVAFTLLNSFNSFAAIPPKLLQEMVPTKGFLIKAKDDLLLLDLDAKKGVKEGDLFTIFSPGEAITHPVSKKIVAILEEKAGVVKIMKVKDGYSTAKRISGTKEIREGFRVEKFTDLRVLYLDYADDRKLYDELRMTFQNMEWETYEKGLKLKSTPSQVAGLKGYDLYVVAEKNKIALYDGRLDKIREHRITAPEANIIRKAASGEEASARTMVGVKGAAERYKKLFSVNRMIRSMDGRKINGIPYYILASDDEVMLYRYENGQMTNMATIRDFEGEPVAIFLEDMDNNGTYEIVVDSYKDGAAQTTVYSMGGGRVSKLSGPLPFFTALYDTDGDGVRETKLIQYIEGDNFWGRIEKVSFQNGVFRETRESAPVPSNFHILGGFIADIDGDGSLEAGFYSPSGSILIYRGNKQLWTSSATLGGSVFSVLYKVGAGEFHQIGADQFQQTKYVVINQPPAVVDINGDKTRQILIGANEASGYNVISSNRKYTNGYVSYLGKSETGFRVVNISDKIDAPVQSIALIGNEIVFTAVRGDSFSGKGDSNLFSFPLK